MSFELFIICYNVCLLSDPDDLRVIFGQDPLEDDRTLGFYKIKHLSVLLFVVKMPGG
uniref:Ubiquitin-like domain-containing protein n=1 Tax=Sinocyclocheilus rhinocerous TaxID=307959 RepID=A0A673MVF8_9TELE